MAHVRHVIGKIVYLVNPANTGMGCGGPGGENTSFTPGKWYQVTGVKNGGTFNFYVNGSLQVTTSVSSPKTSGTSAIRLGAGAAPIMQIAGLRIYSSALSAATIERQYALDTMSSMRLARGR